jgi:hypothetical protein
MLEAPDAWAAAGLFRKAAAAAPAMMPARRMKVRRWGRLRMSDISDDEAAGAPAPPTAHS